MSDAGTGDGRGVRAVLDTAGENRRDAYRVDDRIGLTVRVVEPAEFGPFARRLWARRERPDGEPPGTVGEGAPERPSAAKLEMLARVQPEVHAWIEWLESRLVAHDAHDVSAASRAVTGGGRPARHSAGGPSGRRPRSTCRRAASASTPPGRSRPARCWRSNSGCRGARARSRSARGRAFGRGGGGRVLAARLGALSRAASGGIGTTSSRTSSRSARAASQAAHRVRLAVIPARGGSARIPGKNVRAFAGRPLIARSIDAALASARFDRVIVSTDDASIAAIAREHGAQVPFVRPVELGDAHTGTGAVVAHAIERMVELGEPPDEVCCVYATAPFLRAEDLVRGLDALAGAPARLRVLGHHLRLPDPARVRCRRARAHRDVPARAPATRSQDLPEAWHDAGQFYWRTPGPGRPGRRCSATPRCRWCCRAHRVQDIDTPEDWRRAELMFAALEAGAAPPDEPEWALAA